MFNFVLICVTLWHGFRLNDKELTNFIMISLKKQYETARKQANSFMKNGQITQYFEALLEMNEYKRLLKAVVAN